MANDSGSDYRYPWRDGNHLELLIDGEEFFPAMLEAIASAQQFILLELYLMESGVVANRFIDALGEAAKRGVEVLVLLDDYGAHALHRNDRQRLVAGGASLRMYNPLHYGKLRRNFLRDHRKLLVCDHSVAFVGGAGLVDEFDRQQAGSLVWHETMVAVRGPCVADWADLFCHTWQRWSPHPFWPPEAILPALEGGQPGRVTSNNAPKSTEINRSLVVQIRRAERRVWITSAYFLPSIKIRRALQQAAERGIDVRLMLPGPHTDHPSVRHAARRYYARLFRHGVRIWEYQPRFLHVKMLLCDEWVSIGSSNVDRWNWRWNLENNQEAWGGELLAAAESLFVNDLQESTEVLAHKWHHRPWWRRLKEWFWGKVDHWLASRLQVPRNKDKDDDQHR